MGAAARMLMVTLSVRDLATKTLIMVGRAGLKAGQQLGRGLAGGARLATTAVRLLGGSILALLGPLAALTGIVGGFTAVLGGLAAIVTTSAKFEHQMQQVRAVMQGLTDKEFKELTQAARDLGATTVFAATQAAQGMEILAKASFTKSQVLGAIPGLLSTAAAGQLELHEASTIIIDTLGQFHLSAEKAGAVADILALGAISANTDIRQLGEAIKFAGAAAKGAQVPFTELVSLLVTVAQGGIRASQSGVAFQRVISSLLAPSKQAAFRMKQLKIDFEGFQEGAISLTDVLGQLATALREEAGIALEVFGQRGGRGAQVAAQQGAAAIEELRQKLLAAGGTAEEVGRKRLNSFIGSLTLMKSALQEVLIALGTEGDRGGLLGRLRIFVDDVITPGLRRMGAFVKVVGGIIPIFHMFKEVLKGFGRDILKVFSLSLGGIVQFATDLPSTILDVLVKLPRLLANLFTTVLGESFKILMAVSADLLTKGLPALWKLIKETFVDFTTWITTGFAGLMQKAFGEVIFGTLLGIAEGVNKVLPESRKFTVQEETLRELLNKSRQIEGAAFDFAKAAQDRMGPAISKLFSDIEVGFKKLQPMIVAAGANVLASYDDIRGTLTLGVMPSIAEFSKALSALGSGEGAQALKMMVALYHSLEVAAKRAAAASDPIDDTREFDPQQSFIMQMLRSFSRGFEDFLIETGTFKTQMIAFGRDVASSLRGTLREAYGELLFPDRQPFKDAMVELDNFVAAFNINDPAGMNTALQEFASLVPSIEEAGGFVERLRDAADFGRTGGTQVSGLEAILTEIDSIHGAFADESSFTSRLRNFFETSISGASTGVQRGLETLLANQTLTQAHLLISNVIGTGNSTGDTAVSSAYLSGVLESNIALGIAGFGIARVFGLSNAEAILISGGMAIIGKLLEGQGSNSWTSWLTAALETNMGAGLAAFSITRVLGLAPVSSVFAGIGTAILNNMITEEWGTNLTTEMETQVTAGFQGLLDLGGTVGSYIRNGLANFFGPIGADMRDALSGAFTGAASALGISFSSEFGTQIQRALSVGGTVFSIVMASTNNLGASIASGLGGIVAGLIGGPAGMIFGGAGLLSGLIGGSNFGRKEQIRALRGTETATILSGLQRGGLTIPGLGTVTFANRGSGNPRDVRARVTRSTFELLEERFDFVNDAFQSFFTGIGTVSGLQKDVMTRDLLGAIGRSGLFPLGQLGNINTFEELESLEGLTAITDRLGEFRTILDTLKQTFGFSSVTKPIVAEPGDARSIADILTGVETILTEFKDLSTFTDIKIATEDMSSTLTGTNLGLQSILTVLETIRDNIGSGSTSLWWATEFNRQDTWAIRDHMERLYSMHNAWSVGWGFGSFAQGGPVTQTGPAMVHAGEFVVDRDTVASMGMESLRAMQSGGGGGSGGTIVIQTLDPISFEQWLSRRGGGDGLRSYLRSESQNGEWFLHKEGVRE